MKFRLIKKYPIECPRNFGIVKRIRLFFNNFFFNLTEKILTQNNLIPKITAWKLTENTIKI